MPVMLVTLELPRHNEDGFFILLRLRLCTRIPARQPQAAGGVGVNYQVSGTAIAVSAQY